MGTALGHGHGRIIVGTEQTYWNQSVGVSTIVKAQKQAYQNETSERTALVKEEKKMKAITTEMDWMDYGVRQKGGELV